MPDPDPDIAQGLELIQRDIAFARSCVAAGTAVDISHLPDLVTQTIRRLSDLPSGEAEPHAKTLKALVDDLGRLEAMVHERLARLREAGAPGGAA